MFYNLLKKNAFYNFVGPLKNDIHLITSLLNFTIFHNFLYKTTLYKFKWYWMKLSIANIK